MAYTQKVVDHFENPRNVGSLDKEASNVGTGLVGAPECGDVMKLQIQVNDETGKIEDARFKTFGCGSAIAASSLATEWVKDKTIDEALEVKNVEIEKDKAKVSCLIQFENVSENQANRQQKLEAEVFHFFEYGFWNLNQVKIPDLGF